MPEDEPTPEAGADEQRDDENAFERYDIDPMQGPVAITERMRTLAEEATTEREQRAIRAAWEELTRHPARRFEAAVGAHPDSHRAAGAPPPPPPVARSPLLDPQVYDLTLRPSVLEALGLEEEAAASIPDPPLEDDPVLGE